MKKSVCLFLCLLVLLSFAGCKSKKGGDISDALNESNSESNNTVQKEKFADESKFIDAATGVWKFSSNLDNRSGFDTIEISKDYTISFDDKNGTWDFAKETKFSGNEKESENYVEQDLDDFSIWADFSDGTKEELKIFKQKNKNDTDKYYTLKISGKVDTFLNESDFKSVQITLDNYQEYFELKDYFNAGKDKFGDYNGDYTYGVYLTLKDGIDIKDSISSVEYKYSFSDGTYGFEFNKSTGEYKLLDNISKYNDVYQSNERCTMRDDGKYAGKIGTSNVSEVQPGMGITKYDYIAEYPENINITGIMGTLYIYKN